jgi:hypothetical protein
MNNIPSQPPLSPPDTNQTQNRGKSDEVSDRKWGLYHLHYQTDIISTTRDLKNPRSNSQEWRGSGDIGGIFSS